MEENLLRSIWVSLPAAVIILDNKDSICELNSAAETLMNISRKKLLGNSIWKYLTLDSVIKLKFHQARINKSQLVVNDIKLSIGKLPIFHSNLKFWPISSSETHMLLLILPHELSVRKGQMQNSKVGLKSVMGMADILTHEIKNPLAGIKGAAQLLSMNLNSKEKELTNLILDETKRILNLLDQVERFGHLKPPQKKTINIHDVLSKVLQSAKLGFGANIVFVEEYDPSLPLVLGDADQLFQVFLNLIKNASEALKNGTGEIKVRTFYEHSFRLRFPDKEGLILPIQIEIIDNGVGIPSNIAEEILEPFVSGKENGKGLGLALVNKILFDHNGQISVDSNFGETVFRISLPAVLSK